MSGSNSSSRGAAPDPAIEPLELSVHALPAPEALVEQMRAIDTSGVEPLSHPIAAIEPALALRLREDAVTESNRRDDYQQPAPATQDGLYLVPKVIE